MRIKDEYKGKTIVKQTSVGNKTFICANIDVSKYEYFVSIGLGHIFEESTATQPIRYEGIEQEVPKPKRKRVKKNAPAE